MPLPNRVTPFGVVEASQARGMFMGNRGCLVDGRGRLARRWRGERWLICLLAFRGRRRHPLMVPGRYTELFFLDEATGLAAGHRPCRECRRADLEAFRAAWLEIHPGDAGSLTVLDHRLHEERTGASSWSAPCGRLPDGAMVVLDGAAWLVLGEAVLAWSHGGYTSRRTRPSGVIEVITPPSIVKVLAAGWAPVLHASARASAAT